MDFLQEQVQEQEQEEQGLGVDFVEYVKRSLKEDGEFFFLHFEYLHRLNITHIQARLAEIQQVTLRDAQAFRGDLSNVQTLLEAQGATPRHGTRSLSRN